MTKYLIVFVDSLPYERLSAAPFVASLPFRTRVIPGLGYSVNLLPELFLGERPDEVGFYGEWTYGPEDSPFRYRRLGGVFQALAQCDYYIDRFLHKVLGRFLRVHLAQIPFDMLHYFSHQGQSVYESPLVERAIFSCMPYPIKMIRAEDLRSTGMGSRDRAALDAAHDALDCNLFLSLVDLDGFGHKYGVDSKEHASHVGTIDARIRNLWSAFLQANQTDECVLFVLSDHGMSNVYRGVELDLVDTFGECGPTRYVCFLDSTILRVWVNGTGLKAQIANHLTDLGVGRLLTAEERRILGVTARYTGDLLFVLDEGAVFSPSFHGVSVPRGMHGYYPDVPLQHAVLATSRQVPAAGGLRSWQVFELLRNELAA